MTNPNKPLTGNLTISQEEISALPLKSFKGKIVLLQEESKIQRAFDEIKEHTAIGFDTETRPSFKKGVIHSVSLMQVAIPDKVFLVRLNQTGLTKPILDFLENGVVRKAGIGIRDDIKALVRLSRFQPGGFTELSALARGAGLQVESVKKLAALLLGFRISKSAQTSNWEAATLTKKQLEYAATDAWVCLEIYKKLIG
ncbi:MAG: 3'-5' exonuclease domain-containing protein 2 [Cyclobacteriaceae bacterium]|nr:3'-5' exonuclease domain-containing protein 2 [Cyclobacteriaceae bacterium]